jgi:hypothetical protein
LSFQQIGEEASSNFSCFEFLLANGRVLRDRKPAVEYFSYNGNPFCSVTRFVLRIGRHRTKLPAPLLMNYLGGIISTNRILLVHYGQISCVRQSSQGDDCRDCIENNSSARTGQFIVFLKEVLV